MRRAAIIAALGLMSPTFAEGPARLQHAQTHNPLDCYCRAQGRVFAPGETVCLSTDEGRRIAECRMVTNVMSWGLTQRPCPEA
jgi:hypothetical protein